MADKAVKLTQFSRSMTQVKTYADTEDAKVKTAVEKEIEKQIEETKEELETSLLPDGGAAGQILAKKTDADQDVEWIDAPQGGGDSVTVDSVLSKTSTNPVQNKVIAGALETVSEAVQDISTALDDKVDVETGKGLSTNDYSDEEKDQVATNKSAIETLNGTGEGSVKKAVADEIAKVVAEAPEDFDTLKEIADYIASDKTKAAEIESAIASLQTNKANKTEIPEIATAAKAGLVKPGSGLNITSDGTLVVTTPVDGNTKTAATYTVEYDANTHSLIRRKLADDGNGYDADFTPQTIELPDWSGEIAAAKAGIESEVGAVANAGAKNLMPMQATDYESNGITMIVNGDGSATINGTATDITYFRLARFTLSAGKYTLNGCPSGGAMATYGLFARRTSVTPPEFGYDFGEGNTFMLVEDDSVDVFIQVSTTTVNDLVFKPMIRSASITDNTYVPYGKTNAQITQELSDTGWQNGTNTSERSIEATPTDNAQRTKYRRKNGLVTLDINVRGVKSDLTAGAAWRNLIDDLPVGFRPSTEIHASLVIAAKNGAEIYPASLGITSAGGVLMNSKDAVSKADLYYIRGSVSYPV